MLLDISQRQKWFWSLKFSKLDYNIQFRKEFSRSVCLGFHGGML